MTITVSLAELRATYLRDTHPPATAPTTAPPAADAVTAEAVTVLGVSGGVGATTVALAVAEALAAARVVEYAPPHASGLAGAAVDELGVRDGWSLGRRTDLDVVRRLHRDATLPRQPGWTVADRGVWTGEDLPTGVTVVVAPCSVPGVRRLEAVVHNAAHAGSVVPVLTRVPRRMPREVTGAAGATLRSWFAARRVHLMPECRLLAVRGLTPDPLPRSLQQCAAGLALTVKDLS